jgi:hypothetical protein
MVLIWDMFCMLGLITIMFNVMYKFVVPYSEFVTYLTYMCVCVCVYTHTYMVTSLAF